MLRQSNHLRYLSAASVLALGTACAANVYLKPPSYRGPDTAQLRQLADRVATAPPLQEAPLYIPPARHFRPASSSQASSERSARKSTASQVTRTVVTEAPNPEEIKPTPAAAVKQIALMGVTQQGEAPTAWLVDIATQERETATPGESAFGFVVKEIGSETVLLTQDGEEFTVRMGDKEIPIPEPDPSTTTPVVAQNPNTAVPVQVRGGRRAFNRGGNWSGRWNGGGGNRNWGGNRNRGGNNSGSNFGGNFRGNFGGFGGRGFSQGNNRNSNMLRPTANPQEARRRGTRLIGGSNPIPAPATIRNPQTSRRRGTNSGRAFGSDPNWR